MLVERGASLRDAGVREIRAGAFAAKLDAPTHHGPVVEPAEERKPEDLYRDPMSDPDTFGGAMPGFQLDRLREDDDL